MITNPLSDEINIGSVWGLMSYLAGAVLVIALRNGKSDEPITVALWHNGIGAVMYPVLLMIWLPQCH